MNVHGEVSVAKMMKAVAITTSDTVAIAAGPTNGLYIGGAGNVAAIMKDGTSVTFNALSVGVVHPLSVKQIRATGTTATGIIGLY